MLARGEFQAPLARLFCQEALQPLPQHAAGSGRTVAVDDVHSCGCAASGALEPFVIEFDEVLQGFLPGLFVKVQFMSRPNVMDSHWSSCIHLRMWVAPMPPIQRFKNPWATAYFPTQSPVQYRQC